MMADGHQPEVVLLLDAFPNRALNGRVSGVARVELQVAPTNLSRQAGGQMATETDPVTGEQRPLSTSYHARVELDIPDQLRGLLSDGQQGAAKISTRWQSLGQRLYRYIVRTFRFEL